MSKSSRSSSPAPRSFHGSRPKRTRSAARELRAEAGAAQRVERVQRGPALRQMADFGARAAGRPLALLGPQLAQAFGRRPRGELGQAQLDQDPRRREAQGAEALAAQHRGEVRGRRARERRPEPGFGEQRAQARAERRGETRIAEAAPLEREARPTCAPGGAPRRPRRRAPRGLAAGGGCEREPDLVGNARRARERSARLARPRFGVDPKSRRARELEAHALEREVEGRLQPRGRKLGGEARVRARRLPRIAPIRLALREQLLRLRGPRRRPPTSGRSASANASAVAKPSRASAVPRAAIRSARRSSSSSAPAPAAARRAMRSSCGRRARASPACASPSAKRRLCSRSDASRAASASARAPASASPPVTSPNSSSIRSSSSSALAPSEVLEPHALARLAPGLEARAQVGHRRRILGYACAAMSESDGAPNVDRAARALGGQRRLVRARHGGAAVGRARGRSRCCTTRARRRWCRSSTASTSCCCASSGTRRAATIWEVPAGKLDARRGSGRVRRARARGGDGLPRRAGSSGSARS